MTILFAPLPLLGMMAPAELPARWDQASDESLLLRYRDRQDWRAFEILVQRYERELAHYLRRVCGDAALAEDAFQATFLQLHLKCGQFDANARLRPWLYTIATHQGIDALRKARRHHMVSLDRTVPTETEDVGTLMGVLVGHENGPSQNLQTQERYEWLRTAVHRLPQHLERVVTLAYFQGLKYREIASNVGVPVGTIKSRLHAAIKKLQEAWLRDHPEDTDEVLDGEFAA